MKQLQKIAAIFLALAMLLSLTVLPAFAEDEEVEGEGVMTLTAVDEGEGEVVADFSELFDDDAEGEAVEEKEDLETDTDGAEVTATGIDAETEITTTAAEEESKGLSTNAIVWIVLGGVVLVAAVVLCIIFREKVGKFFRVYKSEIKKIVWLPWDQTKKSTLVVLVILIICAAAICLVDLGLSKGFLGFLKLFQKA